MSNALQALKLKHHMQRKALRERQAQELTYFLVVHGARRPAVHQAQRKRLAPSKRLHFVDAEAKRNVKGVFARDPLMAAWMGGV